MQSSRILFLGLFASPLGCFILSPAEGTGGSSGELASSTTTETTLPATGESSGDASTSSSSGLDSTGPGELGTSSDSGDSTTGSPGSSLRLYTRFLGAAPWSVVSLDDVWVGPSAPPTEGILATVSLTHFDRFIVFCDDGYTYQQVSGVWIDPIATIDPDLFPEVGTMGIDAASHLPEKDGTTVDTVIIQADSHALIYRMYVDGSVSFVEDVPLVDERYPGPPNVSGQLRWAFTRVDLLDPSNEWWQVYEHYDDGILYYTDATGTWIDNWPILDNEFFKGNADEPDPTIAVATWIEGDSLNVIAP